MFAHALIHHPKRIPAKEAFKIKRAIPARIAFVETLLPKGKPLHFAVEGTPDSEEACSVDLENPGELSDILSNALRLGLRRKESDVKAFLDEDERKV